VGPPLLVLFGGAGEVALFGDHDPASVVAPKDCSS
jgi:hypothetical protein